MLSSWPAYLAAFMCLWHSAIDAPSIVPRAPQRVPRIAVLDFSNGTPIDPATVEPLRRVLGTTLAGSLARSGRAHVVERHRLAALLAEQDLAASGRIDDASAARIGKLLGVDHLLAGAYLAQPNGELLVSTRLVDVTTGLVRAGPEMTGDLKGVTKLMTKLSDAVVSQWKLPAPTGDDGRRPAPGNARDSKELSAAIDALGRACDRKDANATASARAAVERAAPGHPALLAPC